MKIIKIKPDIRTPGEWMSWAKSKIENKPRQLMDNEIDELELGHCSEFDQNDLFKQMVNTEMTSTETPPNYIGK